MRASLAFIAACAIALSLGATTSIAVVPNTINYQGKLTDTSGAPVPDGAMLIKFTIYDAVTGGTALWNSGFQSITTSGGLFSYDLGSVVALPDLFGTDSVRFLGITVGTNPELSPRTRFTSSGYTLKALKSELALNADSLGGLQPAYYLDWANMTSIPAGFADGLDDVGIDQATADSQYVKKTGDTITGNLNFQSGGIDQIAIDADSGNGINIFGLFSGEKTAQLSGAIRGEVRLWDDQNPPIGSAQLSATSIGGVLQLKSTSGASTIALLGDRPGDLSVIIPDDAINSMEMLDEPGIAANYSDSFITLSQIGMIDLITVTITIPSAGYIFLQGRATLLFQGTLSHNKAFLQIDETKFGDVFPRRAIIGFERYSSTFPLYLEGTAQRIVFKSAGTYTFRLEAKRNTDTGGSVSSWGQGLTALFIPTSYGSVTTVADQPGDNPTAKAVSVTSPDGTISTAYKMDLRYYEEKARAAEIARQKAELAEAQAELELINAQVTDKKK